jgi:demethylmenaquinone methyltransferase/2-methoxy-6-polyprenyl-1,4-benzoquinol methylase
MSETVTAQVLLLGFYTYKTLFKIPMKIVVFAHTGDMFAALWRIQLPNRLIIDLSERMESSSSMEGIQSLPATGIHIMETAAAFATTRRLMSRFNKALKTGLVTGLCGLGVYAVAKKLKLVDRVADLAHSVEAVPFPGANLYEFLTARYMRSMYAGIAEEIAAAGHVDHILDLGTGVGYLPIELSLRDPEASIVGLDYSPDMIRIAKTNAIAETHSKKVHFRVADSSSIPYPGRYFDLITSVIAMHHWSDPSAIMEEVYYALKPGGEFWIYDYRREVPAELWAQSESKLPGYLRIPYKVGPEASWKASLSEERLREIVSKTSFELVELDIRTLTIFDIELSAFNRIVLRKPK